MSNLYGYSDFDPAIDACCTHIGRKKLTVGGCPSSVSVFWEIPLGREIGCKI